ncbi:ribosome maturation factor RimM [Micrococcus sp. IITD107]|uniref:ribosome maturation factor RimM n=1 Tax=Micrococcus sp. IITD107 TaxID=3342790 RepID=UPI0035BB53AF
MSTESTESTESAADDLVRVARIGKPHGIRGEVTVQLFTDAPEERFVPGAQLQTRAARGATAPALLTVTRARWNKEILVLAFQECPDRNAADALRGTELFAAPDVAGEDDAWYEEDLLGLAVLVDGERVGEVAALITGEVQDLLDVELDERHGGHRALIPFVDEIVPDVDLDAQTVLLTPPPGLLTLNAETDEDKTAAGPEAQG